MPRAENQDPYWNTVAARWDDWGAPLRPAAADLAAYVRLLRAWRGASHATCETALLGVTPELALQDWPWPLRLTALDLSLPMIERVWPGDVPGRRRALCADWMTHNFEPAPELVLTDGAPVFFPDPRLLFERVHAVLAPGGAFVFRAFCAPDVPESIGSVFADAREGRIPNFHVLKWRVAQALQPSAMDGVQQHTVWESIRDARLDYQSLPQPGFGAAAVSTIEFYRDATARLHFPTQLEYTQALGAVFGTVHRETPGGLFGERCPVFLAQKAAA